MKKNQTIVFIILAVFGLSCGLLGNKTNVNETGNSNSINNNNVSNSTPIAKAECPKYPISVSETKDKGLEKYIGCVLSVKGKVWDVTSSVITLIDSADRTDYNYSLFIGGNFSGGTYFEIGQKISKLKADQQFDRMPVATFAGTVEKTGDYTSLKNCVLSDVQR
jgi:hypothetical protein